MLARDMFIILMLAAQTVASLTRAAANEPRTGRSVTTLISELQELHRSQRPVFVEQNALDGFIAPGGGGACPTATAVNALQLLRSMVGHEPLENVYKVAVDIFNEQPRLLEGRVDNRQFNLLLKRLEERIPGYQIDVVHRSAANSQNFPKGDLWTPRQPMRLSTGNNRLSILVYTVTHRERGVLGRHFVILKQSGGDDIEVFDPTSVVGRRAYKVERENEDFSKVFLRYGETFTNELCDVFEVRLLKEESDIASFKEPTVKAVIERLDALADELAEKGKLKAPRSWRRRSSEFRLPALDMPQAIGGLDWPASKMIQVFRAAGRHDLNLRDVVGGAHGRILVDSRSKTVRSVAEKVAAGNAYIAIVITEPLHGTDYRSMKTSSERTDHGYKLNGQKLYNARLKQATHFVVFAKSPSGTAGKVAAFLVPRGTPGVDIVQLGAVGLTGNSFGGMNLTNVELPKSALIGDEENGSDLFTKHFRYWRMMQTAAAIGTGEAALSQMAERLLSRNVNGRPIGRFTHLQQPLAQHSIGLKMAYSLLQDAARLYDNANFKDADVLINGLKAEGVEIAIKAVDSAMRAFGAEGYSDRVDLGSRHNDLLGLRIADGTTDVMRSTVASALYGKELWYIAIRPRHAPAKENSRVDDE